MAARDETDPGQEARASTNQSAPQPSPLKKRLGTFAKVSLIASIGTIGLVMGVLLVLMQAAESDSESTAADRVSEVDPATQPKASAPPTSVANRLGVTSYPMAKGKVYMVIGDLRDAENVALNIKIDMTARALDGTAQCLGDDVLVVFAGQDGYRALSRRIIKDYHTRQIYAGAYPPETEGRPIWCSHKAL